MPNTNVAVALLYEQQELGRHLRDALTSLGTPIVYEAEPAKLDLAALESSGARVVVVNLDPAVESQLDDVYSLLDDDRYSVVFNDAQVSSELSGWDQARWARHLAAKILGDADIDPPRPEGSEAVPVPAPGAVAESAPSIEEPDDDEIGIIEEPEAAAPRPALEEFQEESAAETRSSDPLGLLDSRYDALNKPATAEFPSPPPPPADAFDFSTLEALTAAPSPPPAIETEPAIGDESIMAVPSAERIDAPVPAVDDAGPDALGELTIEMSSTDAGGSAADSGFDLDALDALFDEKPAQVPERTIEVGDLDFGAIEESVTIEANTSVDDGAPDFPSLSDIAFEDTPAPAVPSPQTGSSVSSLKLAAAADWSLEDMLEGEAPEPPPTGPADFGVEKVSAAEYLAPDTENAAPPPIPEGEFSFELMPMEEAVAPQPVEREAHEAWLDPDKVVVAKIRRVWVLGASIGGPEAVREFLGELPRDYPALFLLAQHMGAEFVDLMAQQLAKSTPLTVRTPAHGERVGHGEIVIVPTTHRLQVELDGTVVLERSSSDAAYSPSIDQVLRDAADRYGANASAIIFSGMTTDAIEGSKYLAQKGGTIYAQHPDTCVVSSMIDGVVEAGIVKFLGAPKELADVVLAEASKNKR